MAKNVSVNGEVNHRMAKEIQPRMFTDAHALDTGVGLLDWTLSSAATKNQAPGGFLFPHGW